MCFITAVIRAVRVTCKLILLNMDDAELPCGVTDDARAPEIIDMGQVFCTPRAARRPPPAARRHVPAPRSPHSPARAA